MKADPVSRLPETADVVDAVRTGLTKLLPPEDLAQVDLETDRRAR